MQTQTERKIAEEQRRLMSARGGAKATPATGPANFTRGNPAPGRRRRTRRAESRIGSQRERQTSHRQAESTRLRALGEAEPFAQPARQNLKHTASVSKRSGPRLYFDATNADCRRTQRRIVPDVSVSGASANPGIVDGMLVLDAAQSNERPRSWKN